jgi:hypothetical protein
MKRAVAAIVLVSALGVLVKLAFKEDRRPPAGDRATTAVGPGPAEAPVDEAAAIRAKYPAQGELVDRVLERYRRTAMEVERTDGLRGLTLLDRLDLEAIFLYEKHPDEFRRLAATLTDEAAADLLLHWSAYFGLKRADDVDRGALIAEIARLSPSRRRLAGKYPHALPLILAEPAGVCELIRRLGDEPRALDEALIVLDFISLEHGPDDLRRALRTLEANRPLALDAFRQFGPEGFALVTLYEPVLRALGDGLPLDQALIVLRVNTDYVDELLRTRAPETVASYLRHAGAAGLVEQVGGSPEGLRLSVEYGEAGDRALAMAGSDAAEVVFGEYDDPVLRNQAVLALGRFGPMASVILAKYATDADFRAILRQYGADVVPPVARADVAPEVLLTLQQKPRRSFTESLAKEVLSHTGESGQATIRLIRNDGLARARELDSAEVQFYQFLPLYDLLHLAGVVGRGHAPTGGEMTWALIDGCFVVWDVVTLSAAQPQAAAAAEAARAELRATARVAGRELAEEAAGSAAPALARRGVEAATSSASRASRWWAVRAAGGTYRVLRRLPEALEKMTLSQVSSMARPLCLKAGLRLSTWAPVRLLKDGAPYLLRIPPGRWAKYVGINAAQAGLGVVAMHKMEEHLASKRP